MPTMHLKFGDPTVNQETGKLCIAATFFVTQTPVPAQGIQIDFEGDPTPSQIINAIRSKALQEANSYLTQQIPQGSVIMYC